MNKKEFERFFDEMIRDRREEMRSKYNRVLPSGEIIYNRFDKSRDLDFGEGSSVYDTSVIMGDIKVGSHVWIGPYTLVEGATDVVEIGDYVTLDSGVMVYTHDSTMYYVSGGVNPFESGPVKIGSYTVIGTMSIINCGVTIGTHCVVAANSFVNADVPDNTIVAGNPAKAIGRVIVKDNGEVEFEYE